MSHGGISPGQRFTKRNPCPICNGGDGDKRGRGIRCWGYLGDDEQYAYCTNDGYAGGLSKLANGTYKHKLSGPCNCGEEHGATVLLSPLSRHAPAPVKVTRAHRNAKPTEMYEYRALETGAPLRKLRYGEGKGKRFVWQHSDDAGDWMDCHGDRPTPDAYFAETLENADPFEPLAITEGEKDANKVKRLGWRLVLSPPDGKGSWNDAYSSYAAGHQVVIFADRDADGGGLQHAERVAASVALHALSVRIVLFEEAHDVGDWIDAGGAFDELRQIAAAAPMRECEIKHEFHDASSASSAYETLLAQNRAMNEKLLWIFDVLAVPQKRMSHSEKCLLIVARRNAEWRALPQDDDGFTPDYLETLGEKSGMSDGTAGKNLRTLEEMGAVVIKKFTETKTDDVTGGIRVLPRIAYSVGPAIAKPNMWMPKDGPRENRGGRREGAGRPKKCVECGSEHVTERTVRELRERIVIEVVCSDCGMVTPRTLSEKVVGHEITYEREREIDVDFHESPVNSTIPYEREHEREPKHISAPLFRTDQTLESRADTPSPNHHVERAEVCKMAEALGWQRMELSQGVWIGGSAESWQRFIVSNPPERIDAAHYVLVAALPNGEKAMETEGRSS
jgi:hypothetical protein